MIAASAIELFVKRVWYRDLTRIQTLDGAPPETSATYTPRRQASHEGHWRDYLPTFLVACAVSAHAPWLVTPGTPSTHHTLSTTCSSLNPFHGAENYGGPTPSRVFLNLVYLTLRIRGCSDSDVSSLKRLDCCILRHLRALNNVEQLMIDYLDTLGFVPRIRRHFGHFMPTVQHLSLKEPNWGSRRQIIYFIGLAQRPSNLGHLYDGIDF